MHKPVSFQNLLWILILAFAARFAVRWQLGEGDFWVNGYTFFFEMSQDIAHGKGIALDGGIATRDGRVRGEGVGDLLLADAVRRVISASRSLAVFTIVVEALDKMAAAFYRDFGFAPFPSRPLRLFMPVSEATEAVSRAASRQ